jgi:hypothetical protein
MKKNLFAFAVLLALLLRPDGAWALDDLSSLQCEEGIVSIGDAKFEVQQKCGEPTRREQRGDLWIYDFGSDEFVYYLFFVEERLERIQVGGYGD